MAITYRVFWHNMPDREAWDELTHWAFGFMGAERYRACTVPTTDYMDFTFDDEQDAMIFQLRCGHARRLSQEEITTSYVGTLIR